MKWWGGYDVLIFVGSGSFFWHFAELGNRWMMVVSGFVGAWILGRILDPVIRHRRLMYELSEVMLRIAIAIHEGGVTSEEFTAYLEESLMHMCQDPSRVHLNRLYNIDRTRVPLNTFSIEHPKGNGRKWDTTPEFWLIFYLQVGREFCRKHQIP